MKKQELLSAYKKLLKIENYSDQTIKSYYSALRLFLEWISESKLEKVTEKSIEDYLFHCKTKRNYSFSSMKLVTASIRYLYLKVLKKDIPEALNIQLRKPNILPIVLSSKEISKIFNVTINLKHKTILVLIYSAGLRLGELLNLKLGDIDSESMKIHIRNAKGKRDRYVMLSENVLVLLREYYKVYNPMDYLIEGQEGGKYSPKSVQTVFKSIIKKSRY